MWIITNLQECKILLLDTCILDTSNRLFFTIFFLIKQSFGNWAYESFQVSATRTLLKIYWASSNRIIFDGKHLSKKAST